MTFMPLRYALLDVPWCEAAGSFALLGATTWAMRF